MNYAKLTYYGTVQDGKLKLSDRKRFDDELKLYEGKRIELTVSKAKKRRSANQNAFYWGVLLPILRDGFLDAGNEGVSVDDIHEFLKGRFLPEGKDLIIPKSGEVVTVAKSTTTLSTTDFMAYIEQINQFASEFLGIVLPDPLPLFPIQ